MNSPLLCQEINPACSGVSFVESKEVWNVKISSINDPYLRISIKDSVI